MIAYDTAISMRFLLINQNDGAKNEFARCFPYYVKTSERCQAILVINQKR